MIALQEMAESHPTLTATRFAITDARVHQCGIMARRLRREHAGALLGLGFDAHRSMRQMFLATWAPKAWMIDGELAALGGVVGPMASSEAFIWLALSEHAAHYPLAVVREARRQIAAGLAGKQRLVTSILLDDLTSLRFARFLGFSPEAYGNEGIMFMRYDNPQAGSA